MIILLKFSYFKNNFCLRHCLLSMPGEQQPATSSSTTKGSPNQIGDDYSSMASPKKRGPRPEKPIKRESIDGQSFGHPPLWPPSNSSVNCENEDEDSPEASTRAHIDALFERQWAQWKRLYHGLSDTPPEKGYANATHSPKQQSAQAQQTWTSSPSALPSQTTSARPTVSSSRNSSGCINPMVSSTVGGDVADVDGEMSTSQLLPRLVLVEVNGHRMLYPSQFVGILVNELLPPKPKKCFNSTNGEEEDNQDCPKSPLDDSMEADCSTAAELQLRCGKEADKYGAFSVRMRRRCTATAMGVRVARANFEDALLRPARGLARLQQRAVVGTANTSVSSSATEQRMLDEFNYDYARREFCYCKICPNVSGGAGLAAGMSLSASSTLNYFTSTSSPAITRTPSTPITPFHRDLQQQSPATPSTPIGMQDGQQQRDASSQSQPPTKISSSSRKKASSSSSCKGLSAEAGQPQINNNRWARGCCGNYLTPMEPRNWQGDTPNWNAVAIRGTNDNGGSGFAFLRRALQHHQQQLDEATLAAREVERVGGLIGTAAKTSSAPSSTTTIPVVSAAVGSSTLAELLMDEDDGMGDDQGADMMLVDPMMQHQQEMIMMRGSTVGIPHLPSMLMPSTSGLCSSNLMLGPAPDPLGLLAASAQRRAFMLMDADTFSCDGGKRWQLRRKRGNKKSHLTKKTPTEPPQVNQLDFISTAFDEDSALFCADPFASLPAAPFVTPNKIVDDMRPQQQVHHVPAAQPTIHQQHPSSILARMLCSDGEDSIPATTSLSVAPAKVTTPTQQLQQQFVEQSQQERMDITATLSSTNAMEVAEQSAMIATQANTAAASILIPAPMPISSIADAESMPNAETPPALLDTTVNAIAIANETAEGSVAVAAVTEVLVAHLMPQQCSVQSQENEPQQCSPNQQMLAEGADEERMTVCGGLSSAGGSLVGSPTLSATSPATAPSSVGQLSAGSIALASHRIAPVTAAMLMRAAGEDSHQLVSAHHILSPPASNERIDSSIGSVHSLHHHGPPSRPAAQSTSCGSLGTSSAIFGVSHDTLSRIYPTPPTPIQQFSPQNVLILPPHQQQLYQQQLAHQQLQQQLHPAEDQETETTHRNESDTEERGLLETMEILAKQLRVLPIEQPLYDGVQVRPIVMFGSFTGDLLDERLTPEERLQRCWGGSSPLTETVSEQTNSHGERRDSNSKSRQLRELRDQLYRRRKRLCELSDNVDGVANGLNAFPSPPTYTKRAKMDLVERMAADKAGGDAGLDARLQEFERARLRIAGTEEQMHHQQQQQQFLAGIHPQQWSSPWAMNGPPFPSGAAAALMMAQQRAGACGLPLFPQGMPPGFSPNSQMFPPGTRLPPPHAGISTALMGQISLSRMPAAMLSNPMRSPPGVSASFTPASSSVPGISAARQQQQMIVGGMPPPPMSRSPSMIALQQQQQSLQRRPSLMVLASPPGQTVAHATPSGQLPIADVAAPIQQQSQQTTTTSTSTVLWEGLLLAGKLCAAARVVLLVQDTIADLHYDSVFDACPLCCCNSNIRSAELGVYIEAPRDLVSRCDQLQRKQRTLQQSGGSAAMAVLAQLPKQWSGFRIPLTTELQKCNCGFSAVRHRYLCCRGSGLFPDDIAEAGGFRWPATETETALCSSAESLRWRFSPTNVADCQFLDLLRHLSLARDLSALMRSSRLLNNDIIIEEFSSDNQTEHDYVQSTVDTYELNGIMGTILEMVGGNAQCINPQQIGAVLHPWGYQTANRVGEPRDAECLSIFEELKESIARTAPPHAAHNLLTSNAACASLIPSYSNGRRLEQLTLRAFARKGGSGAASVAGGINKDAVAGGSVGTTTNAGSGSGAAGDADIGRMEPVPLMLAMRFADREPVLVQAQHLRDWERLDLKPIDQPKDVLYVAVVPDVPVMAAKCKVYMEELSNVYERCQLGYHVRVGVRDSPRDGILRVGRTGENTPSTAINGSAGPTGQSHAVRAMFAQYASEFDDAMQPVLQQLKSYVDGCFGELRHFFLQNEHVFERRAFHESLIRKQQQQPMGTSLAAAPDAVAMPPPAVPPLHSGPASATSAMLSSSITTGGPGSCSSSGGPASGGGGVQHSPTAALTPHGIKLEHPHQQMSPAGPNSVPILHGGESLNASNAGALSSTLSNKQTAEEIAQFEEELAGNLGFVMAEEKPNWLPHVICCHLVNPFGVFGSDSAHARLGPFAQAVLLRAWNEFLNSMPLSRRPQLQLELLPLRTVYDCAAFIGTGGCADFELLAANAGMRERISVQNALRRHAFAVYAQARLLQPQVTLNAMSKSMTRFGPMERMKDVFRSIGNAPIFFKYPCNPFVLVPPYRSLCASFAAATATSTSQSNITSFMQNTAKQSLPLLLCSEGERVLLVAYCLLPGDEWLCAAATDERGALLDTALINLEVMPPHAPVPGKEWRHRQRHSQIADALQRLWQFAQSVMLQQEVRNWRLVIGRMGKLGHGEFKQWTEILSKKNLKAYNSALKGKTAPEECAVSAGPCAACAQSHGWVETPALLSACLVSTEPEPHLRVMGSASPGALADSDNGGTVASGGSAAVGGGAGSVTSGAAAAKGAKPSAGSVNSGRLGSRDASAIGTQQWSHSACASLDDRSITHIMVFQTILNVGQHAGEDIKNVGVDDGDGDLFGIGNILDTQEEDGINVDALGLVDLDNNEEETPINNQPMAIGYTVSTAPLPDGLPASFWRACPARQRGASIAHLKSSLHIHQANLNAAEDYGASGGQQRERDSTGAAGAGSSSSAASKSQHAADAQHSQQHPLDAQATDDVLRFVLETYNALSWLQLDTVSGQRRSCMPLHMQAIERLHQAVSSFFGPLQSPSAAENR